MGEALKKMKSVAFTLIKTPNCIKDYEKMNSFLKLSPTVKSFLMSFYSLASLSHNKAQCSFCKLQSHLDLSR